MGTALRATGRLDQAVAHFIQALNLDPSHCETLNNLGRALKDQGKLDEAAMRLRQALALRPDYAEAHLNLATVTEAQGRLEEAAAHYRRAVALLPSNTRWDAHYSFGNVLVAQGKLDEAAAQFRESLALKPDYADAHLNLGVALMAQGKLNDAVACYRAALVVKPDHTGAYLNLGNALGMQGKLDEAKAHFQEALAHDPHYVDARYNLGNALTAQGNLDEAARQYEQALALKPDHAECCFRLGNLLLQLGRLPDAATRFRQTLSIQPDYVGAHHNLGRTMWLQGFHYDAEAQFRRALVLKPDFVIAHNHLGIVLCDLGKMAEAAASYRQAIALQPEYPIAFNNLASVLRIQGRIEESLAFHRRAVASAPEDAIFHSNLIFTLNFDATTTTADQQAERAEWNKRHARRFASDIRPHNSDRNPQRRLRIGYVSSYFRSQAATFAFGGVIFHHDPKRFEVVCYSDTGLEDNVTKLLRERASVWRQTRWLSDEHLADLIRSDGIDILVDLVGHMDGHRLLVFARKPAPIQVTGWGEPTGTGLETMDYLFADAVLVPASERGLLAEEVIDLPNFLGLWVPTPLREPNALPALSRGYVTFGSFSRLDKVQEPVLRVWAKILAAIPGSRIVLKDYRVFVDAEQFARVARIFAEQGVAADRLALLPGGKPSAEHYAAYGDIDIALDPFPHGGGMTTLDALWMGVPVVTSPGRTISSRLAAASLTALGLTDFIAPDLSAYVELAVAKARNLDVLAKLRRRLRTRITHSDFGNPRRYARAVEAAYRKMWRRWCAERSP
jgi:predicted O-linked N-acetylglucosamine transferase (SPINDLY family)